jgi:hypothetical protein
MRNKLLKEIWLLLQYGVISLVATSVALDAYQADWQRRVNQIYDQVYSATSPPAVDQGPPSINIVGMLEQIWQHYYRPWLFCFLVLVAVRLVFVLGYHQWAQGKYR